VQLVELQEAWPAFQQAGVALFAVSYDDIATLSAFAEKHGITYPLLSDEGSATIRGLGLLNEQLEQQHAFYRVAMRDEHRGIPYPGAFVVDERGLIREKHFEQSFRVRPTSSIMLEWALGRADAALEHTVSTPGGSIEVQTWTDKPTYRRYQQLRLHLRLWLPSGVHIHGAPVPSGFEALSVEIEPLEGLEVGELTLPEPRSFQVTGLDDEFVVYEGNVEGMLPFMLTRNLGATRLKVSVRYQACHADGICFPPSNVKQEVILSGLDLIRD
jgi:peroxiredoxin